MTNRDDEEPLPPLPQDFDEEPLPPAPVFVSDTKLSSHKPGTSDLNLGFLFFTKDERFRAEKLQCKDGSEWEIAGVRSPAHSEFRATLFDALCMAFPRIASHEKLPPDYCKWIANHPSKPAHHKDEFVVSDKFVMNDLQASKFKEYILDSIMKNEAVLLHCFAGCGRTGTSLIFAKMIFKISTATYADLLHWDTEPTASAFVEEMGVDEDGDIACIPQNFHRTTPLIAELEAKEREAMHRFGDAPDASPDNPIEFIGQLKFLEKMEKELVQEFLLKKKNETRP